MKMSYYLASLLFLGCLATPCFSEDGNNQDWVQIVGEDSIFSVLGEDGIGCPQDLMDIPRGEMTFKKIADNNGHNVLLMAGGISIGNAKALDSLLYNDRTIGEIWLLSGGGVASEGEAIGRVIRAHGVATRLPAKFQCISSCSIAFAGGIVRHIDPGAAYGVHVFRSDDQYAEIMRLDKANYFSELNAHDQAVLRNPKAKMREWVKFKLSRIHMLKVKAYIHQQERGNALLAVDQAIFMSEMGVSRRFLEDSVYPQRSANHDDDYGVLTSIEPDIFEGLSKGENLSDAIKGAVIKLYRYAKENEPQILETFATYKCLSQQDLRRYNIINTDS